MISEPPLKNKRAGWILLLLFAGTFCFAAAAAQFVEITAEIEMLPWWPSDSASGPSVASGPRVYQRPSTVWPTRCIVGTSNWLVEVTFEDRKEAWCFTGTNFIMSRLQTGYPTRNPELFARNHPDLIARIGHSTTNVFDSLDGNIDNLSDGHWAYGTAYAKIPWLAFCSGSFLKSGGRKIPLASDYGQRRRFTPSDQTKVFEDELGLPSAVDLLTTNGQPMLQYRVAGTTNLLGWEFPLEFHLVQFRPAESNIWQLEMLARGKVSSIGVTTNFALPEAPLPKK